MKDLTHYFISPTKSKEKITETAKIGEDEVVKGDVDEETKVLESIENSGKKKRRKKKKVRKPSDPAVKNITDLLSNGLTLISPNGSLSEEMTDKIRRVNEKIEAEQSKIDSEESPTKTPKNAFQFMMHARNRSIGQNSPGKEREEEISPNSKTQRDKLVKRRNFLESWADKKGASKRKRDEEDKEIFVNQQMEKRAKRLKKLLQVNDNTKKLENFLGVSKKNEEKHKEEVFSGDDEEKEKTGKEIIKIKMFATPKSTRKSKKSKLTLKKKTTEKTNDQEVDSNKKKAKNKTDTVEESDEKEEEKLLEELDEEKKSPKEEKTKHNEPEIESVKKKSKNKNATIEETDQKAEEKLLEDLNEHIEPEIELNKKKNKNKLSPVEETDQKEDEKALEEFNEEVKTRQNEPEIETNKKKSKPDKKKEETKHNEPKNIDQNAEDSNDTPKLKRTRSARLSLKKDQQKNEEIKPEEPRKKRQRTVNKKREEPEIIDLEDEDSKDSIRSKGKRKNDSSRQKQELKNPVLRLRKVREATPESDEEWKIDKPPPKKAAKIAPVFLKATPKPKEDPEVVEARRRFLMSGVPENMKKAMEKQKCLEEKEVEIFPKIQHVQQKCPSAYWSLDSPKLELRPLSPCKFERPPCRDLLTKIHQVPREPVSKCDKITRYKRFIHEFKEENPHYPVYKAFRQIHEKSGFDRIKDVPIPKEEEKRRGRKKRRSRKTLDNSVEIVEVVTPKVDPLLYSMWTEKYKPRCSNDIIGNNSSVNSLKDFLETWLQFSRDIISRKNKADYSSESEFDVTDCDSRDSTRLPGRVIILNGPPGSGKTSAVYAIAEELGLKVLELNASSKRTGKKLLQEMQEATQSHRVQKHEPSMQNFLKTEKTENSKKKSKMSVILIEDVDIVFEQDDNFISALSQLSMTTKRPIILTTTDFNSTNVQKFANYEVLNFNPLSAGTLATWLRIVCLVEGFLVDQNLLEVLLEYNKGDPRKTLLQLQFWLQSGGQLFQTDQKIPKKIDNKRSNSEINMVDESFNLSSVEDAGNTEVFTHRSSHFLDVRSLGSVGLGTIWWNFPLLVSLQTNDEKRLNRFEVINSVLKPKTIKPNKTILTEDEKNQLKLVAQLQDNLAFADEFCTALNYNQDIEPIIKNGQNFVKDSLELDENLSNYGHSSLTSDLYDTFLDKSFSSFSSSGSLNLAVPVISERRWRTTHHICANIFQDAAPLNSSKTPLTLDYLPSLRGIARTEFNRSLNNSKRGNRFRNYLRTLGLTFNESASKLACNVLRWED